VRHLDISAYKFGVDGCGWSSASKHPRSRSFFSLSAQRLALAKLISRQSCRGMPRERRGTCSTCSGQSGRNGPRRRRGGASAQFPPFPSRTERRSDSRDGPRLISRWKVFSRSQDREFCLVALSRGRPFQRFRGLLLVRTRSLKPPLSFLTRPRGFSAEHRGESRQFRQPLKFSPLKRESAHTNTHKVTQSQVTYKVTLRQDIDGAARDNRAVRMLSDRVTSARDVSRSRCALLSDNAGSYVSIIRSARHLMISS